MSEETYKQHTVGSLLATIKGLMDEKKITLDTVVASGDFEGNYLHGKHEIQLDKENNILFLGYEMHEDSTDELLNWGENNNV